MQDFDVNATYYMFDGNRRTYNKKGELDSRYQYAPVKIKEVTSKSYVVQYGGKSYKFPKSAPFDYIKTEYALSVQLLTEEDVEDKIFITENKTYIVDKIVYNPDAKKLRRIKAILDEE